MPCLVEAMINMFNGYFGGGMNTVVFQELRESRGLAYSAWASYQTPYRPADSEFFLTSIISQNDKMTDCIATFNSMNLTNSRELFLYRDVHRTERPKESSSSDSGGSSTHTSSSGTTHGGGGGSF